MLSSAIPSKVPLPFANAGTKTTIPTASQIGITPGAASLTDGFPPLTMTPIAAGGIPPSGADFNGILNLITAVQQWQSAGGIFKYDSAFSTEIGGYPAGAVLMSTDNKTYWLNLADNNATDPDGASPANWGTLASYGIAAVTGLTNANVTLTPAQYSKPIITLSGTLTGNINIIVPDALIGRWTVKNSTTGAFSVTFRTASGTGVDCQQGTTSQLWSDGVNVMDSQTKISGVYRGRAIFASPGTSNFTVPDGVYRVVAEVWGAGGGGSGGSGGSGAGGGYARKSIEVGPGQVISVTVGAGGAGAVNPTASGAGGSSSFGAYCSATGGAGVAAGSSAPTAGGVGSGGDLNLQGQGGTDVDSSSAFIAMGGAAPLGGAGGTVSTGATSPVANGGQQPGGGGAAAQSSSGGATAGSGGGGAHGLVMVWW